MAVGLNDERLRNFRSASVFRRSNRWNRSIGRFEMLDPAEMSEAAILEAVLRLGAWKQEQKEIMRALDRLIAGSRSFRLHALLLVRGVLGE